MGETMNRLKLAGQLMILALMVGLATVAAAQDVVHIVSGVVTKIDKDAKTIAVKTADGTEHVFKYSEKTAVHGYQDASHEAKKGAVDTYFAGKEGTHVVVHYTEKGGDKVASSVEDFGKDSLKDAKGTITKVDQAAHTVKIKTDDGAEETYSVGKNAAKDSEKGAVHGWDYTVAKVKEGDKVAVQYTEEAGKKVIHFFP
jgi:hypothetical protein